MQTKTIGVKQLHQQLDKITRETRRGTSFVVLKHTIPLFRIEPIAPTKKHSWADIKKLQFNSGEKNLSKNIDKIVYGL